MPRNFGIQVNDARFESFINSADKLQRMQLRVGILSGKAKYKPGWVGTKSRRGDSARLSRLQGGEREASMLSAYRRKKAEKGGGTQSFKRKARKKRVSVAKVAAVVGMEFDSKGKGKRPKIPGLWIAATDRNGAFLQQQAGMAMSHALEGRSGKGPIVRFGERLAMAYKVAVITAGHTDTRLLLKTIDWEIADLPREKFMRRQVAAMNKAKKLQREARKRAKL